MKHILLFSFLMTRLFTTTISKVKAQPNEHSSISQKVRGRVTDAASGQPLPGVIVLLLSDNSKHALTDASGYYQFEKIPVGRQSFQFSLMGFENYTAADLMIISGKETELNVALKESLKELGEVTVVAAKNNTRAK